jgi:2-polyprenyl-6-methoxyphenol hydroxylase-like FAD-dependent oxidoreductase
MVGPTLQYLAQGACMAMEDAVTLGEALRAHDNEFAKAYEHYQRSRVARTARIVLSAREMGRIFHAKSVERLVRNELRLESRELLELTRPRAACGRSPSRGQHRRPGGAGSAVFA